LFSIVFDINGKKIKVYIGIKVLGPCSWFWSLSSVFDYDWHTVKCRVST